MSLSLHMPPLSYEKFRHIDVFPNYGNVQRCLVEFVPNIWICSILQEFLGGGELAHQSGTMQRSIANVIDCIHIRAIRDKHVYVFERSRFHSIARWSIVSPIA